MEGTVERGGGGWGGGVEKLWEQPVEEFSFRSKKGSGEEEKVGTMTESVNREEEMHRILAMSC